MIITALLAGICAYCSLGKNADLIGNFTDNNRKNLIFALTGFCMAIIGVLLGKLASLIVKEIALFLSNGIIIVYAVSIIVKWVGKRGPIRIKAVNDVKTYVLSSVLLMAEIIPLSFAAGMRFEPFWAVPFAFGGCALAAAFFAGEYKDNTVHKVMLCLSAVLAIAAAVFELVLNLA